jgi:uncharacterized membrane protein
MTGGSRETKNLSEASKMTPPNDWQIKKCLVLSGSLLVAACGLIGLGALGLDIPVLRQAVAFIFLSFVPGLLLLRILRIHNVHVIESLLYSVGLSLAFVMAVGVVANFALPPLGVTKPIAPVPLISTMTFFLLILGVVAYVRDKGFSLSSRSDNRTSESTWQSFRANPAPYLLAVLLPLLAILGANLVNVYYNNALIFALIFIIVIIIGLAAFNKFIHPRVYPFMIFMMALALLYQTTFISDYLVGSDIHIEHYLSNLVVEDGYWDVIVSGAGAVNSCLSIVMLAPIYSFLLNMDIVWLFKIIYPFFFCLAPLALFRIFSLQIKPKYAFLAVVFFITMPIFMMDMAQLARQQISELFFVMVVLLLVDRKLTLVQRTTLVLVFGFGVVVSYYGLGTAYPIGYLAFGALLLIFIKSRPGRALWQRLIGKANLLPTDLTSPGAFNKKALAIIVVVSLAFMFVYFGVTQVGFMGPRIFGEIAGQTVEQTIKGFATPPGGIPSTPEMAGFIQGIIARFPFLNPLVREPLAQTALGIDFSLASLGGKVWRVFQYLVELCLIVGFFRLIFRPRALGNFKSEYISLTIVSALILLGLYILPTTGYGMGAVRIFGIILLIMSPLVLFGGELIAYGIVKLAIIIRRGFVSSRLSLESPVLLQLLVLVVLIPYFIFNSGAVFELSKSQTTYFIDMPYSIALSGYRVDLTTVFTRQDVIAADWLTAVSNHRLHADIHGCHLFYNYQEARNAGEPESSGCIYLRAWNAQNKVWTVGTAYAARQSISFDDLSWLRQAWEKGDRIYNNGGAQILLDR